ncbi:hypothetical protein KKC45_01605 [Patescibacteria group bacterium]|nr:hypothetical protein [Patescibacteria group bacterium]
MNKEVIKSLQKKIDSNQDQDSSNNLSLRRVNSMNVRKFYSTATLVTVAMFFSAGTCLATPPESGDSDSAFGSVGQGQIQGHDGSSWTMPGNGLTSYGGFQEQNNEGYLVGGNYDSSISANQFEEQNHWYGSFSGDPDNWTGQGGGGYMASYMNGWARKEGGFWGTGGQSHESMITSFNFGPELAVTNTSENFSQGIAGGSWGCWSDVSNWTSMSSDNLYDQFATSGNNWVSHSGEFSSYSSLSGSAYHNGGYGGNIEGNQYGATMTSQGPDGTFQTGNQTASASLNAGTYSYGNAYTDYNAGMTQVHSYSQYSEGPNGSQYQEGMVMTNVTLSGGTYTH